MVLSTRQKTNPFPFFFFSLPVLAERVSFGRNFRSDDSSARYFRSYLFSRPPSTNYIDTLSSLSWTQPAPSTVVVFKTHRHFVFNLTGVYRNSVKWIVSTNIVNRRPFYFLFIYFLFFLSIDFNIRNKIVLNFF